MERRLKERLIGAAVLVMLAVIFIPMVLNNNSDTEVKIEKSNIPARPEETFNSRIVPLQGEDLTPLPVKQTEQELVLESVETVMPTPKEEETEAPVSSSEPEVMTKAVTPVETVTIPDNVVENIEKEAESSSSAASGAVGTAAWVVQLGSFSSKENASGLNEKLRKAGYPSFVEPLKRDKGIAYRVRVGPELKRSNAQKLQQKLNKEMKIEGIIVRYP